MPFRGVSKSAPFWGVLASFFGVLKSAAEQGGKTDKVVRTLSRKRPRLESGLDRLMCAIFFLQQLASAG